jgi:hypothetical protein
MNRMLSKMFWAIIGLGVFFLISLIGVDVRGSTIGGILFVGVIFVIWSIIKNSKL